MSQTTERTVGLPNARLGAAVQTGAGRPVATLLSPVVQSGRVDVSDIAHLSGPELRDVLLGRARALVPLLERNAAATEAGRRVVEENIKAIREAGLFKIMVPRRYGGLETDIRTKLEVSRELARGCGSTSWATTLMNVCAWFAGLAFAEAQDDVWGRNPEARVAGVFAPTAKSRRVDGGLIVTGKWPWASGCLHADWALLGVPVVDADGQETDQGLALIPMPELAIEDTWFVAGMKGIGSNTVVAEEVFIPDHRIVSVPKLLAGDPPTPYKDEALYRSSFIPVAVLMLAGPQLGLCARALEFVIEKAPKRGISYTFYETQTASPSFQLALAEAATLVDGAHLFAYRAADDIDGAARAGRKLSYLERARVRMDTGHAVKTARNAIDTLISAHGAASFADSSPMQRIWRDSETASRHAVISPAVSAEVYGRALLGITEGVTALV
jgi:3-hydroxy-9,10-secoandrosta-1,3,5(10)-triene-9,17-dione monooxygenase